jgi:GTP pyrophosphokinase
MHQVAEEGIAAHWRYKEGRPIEEEDIRNFAWIRSLIEWQSELNDPHEFLNSLKIDLYPEEVYCFTPKGEVKSFPRGATPVDFAYAIHTDIGHQCVGARVNGKMVPLRYRLKNGDIIEVTTSPGHRPSRDWLSLVATSRARSKIRAFLNTNEKQRSIEIGRKVLEKEARRVGLHLKSITESEEFPALLKDYGGSKPEDLFAAVGYGKVSTKQVIARFLPEKETDQKPWATANIAQAVRRVLHSGEKIKVKGVDDLLVYRAKCCNPIPGEKISGYITRGKGVSVHTVKCPNLLNLLHDPERKIEVEWDRDAETRYQVTMSVNVEDRPGMLADITSIIASSNTDIRNIESKNFESKKANIEITLSINDLKHLEKVIRSIRSLDGVLDVSRLGSR